MRKFSIGYRTLKTAIGAAIAIAVAQFFDLQFYTAAGILTILSVQPTKKKSLHAVYIHVLYQVWSALPLHTFFSKYLDIMQLFSELCCCSLFQQLYH